jgi:hypothetical protein
MTSSAYISLTVNAAGFLTYKGLLINTVRISVEHPDGFLNIIIVPGY